MKQRIKNKVFSKWRQRKASYTLNQVLEATSGIVLWVRWSNGYDYHKSLCDGSISKCVREDNCPICKHYDYCKANAKGYPVSEKYICGLFEK